MKTEHVDHIKSSSTDTSLYFSLLIHRIGDELCAMSTTCRDVENALGIIIGQPKEAIDQSIITIQGLDRLRQTLEDLARLSRFIAREESMSAVKISAAEVDETIVLAELLERLTRSKSAQFSNVNFDQDVFWGE